MKTPAPCGSWKSPITSDMIVAETIHLGSVRLDGNDLYWLETRPAEGGRQVVVRRTSGGSARDVTPAGFNVRTRVHEYGGGAYAVSDGELFFSNFTDQRLYRASAGKAPTPITPQAELSFADAIIDARSGMIICVREDHRRPRKVENTIVSVALSGDKEGGRILVSGNDFYSSPRISPDGRRLCWITWNHPNMPWDGTELWVADLDVNGLPVGGRRVAGGAAESIFQPEWSPDGRLYFVSDRSGWWNIYEAGADDREARPLHPMEAEFGQPQWAFGQTAYAFESERRIVCTYLREGRSWLALLDTELGTLEDITTPYTEITSVRAEPGNAACVAGGPEEPLQVAFIDLGSRRIEVAKRSSTIALDHEYISVARPISFTAPGGAMSHALHYPPQNRDYEPLPGERPPLIVLSHGGPTAFSGSMLDYDIQFWTSRGFAVLDVNYGGSTGYGRAYRMRLNGQWGIVDVDDCTAGAEYIARSGLADPQRLVIRGGSAGGYTTLAALTFRSTFKAGASYYGVSDLESLAHDTHKFESRYLDTLVGPYPGRRDLYRERSPIHFVDRLACPLILFQGLEDKIVPPDQSRRMFDALKRKGLPVALVTYEGEQHGFRRADTIKHALDSELYFYSKIFRFEPADSVNPVRIENLLI